MIDTSPKVTKMTSMASIDSRTVLHVGCGDLGRQAIHWSFKEWNQITVDINPKCNPDVIASITDLKGVKDYSVEAVFGSHVLEHICYHEVPLALKEFIRVLKPDGDLLVHMPDLKQACAAVAEGRAMQPLYQAPGGSVAAIDMVYGHRKSIVRFGENMVHKTGFTKEVLEDHLKVAGFIDIVVWVEGHDLWGTGHKENK